MGLSGGSGMWCLVSLFLSADRVNPSPEEKSRKLRDISSSDLRQRSFVIDSAAPETPPQKSFPTPGEEGYEEWLDGPRPEVGAGGRGQWLAGRSHRARAARAAAGVQTPPTGGEQGTGSSEDELVGLLETMARSTTVRDADRLTAIRLLGERRSTAAVPTSVAQVRALTDAQLHQLAEERGLALPWPIDPEALVAQG